MCEQKKSAVPNRVTPDVVFRSMDLAIYRASLLSSLSESSTENYMSEIELLWTAIEQLYDYSFKIVDVGELHCKHCSRFVTTIVDLAQRLIEKKNERIYTNNLEKLAKRHENVKTLRKRNFEKLDYTPRESSDFRRINKSIAELQVEKEKIELEIRELQAFHKAYNPPQTL